MSILLKTAAVFSLLLLIPFSVLPEQTVPGPVVLHVREREIVFSVDPAMELRVGDEMFVHSLVRENRKPGGGQPAALVSITELYPEAGIARVVYGKPGIDDILIPRSACGLDVQSYVGGVIHFSGALTAVPGIRVAGTRGFSGLYPVAGLEFPVAEGAVPGFPFFPYVGMQLVWNIGRLQIIPSGMAGVGLYFPREGEDPISVDYVGGMGEIGITWLVLDSWRVLLGIGYCTWVGRAGLEEDDRYGYNGITLKGGLIWKM
ncbi:hypothetical protein [Marispirochaeta sp.]|uniref:hypothetical protein n=1 Tax=Marispirochaeta sp. TaxID=2038653 RepID=UPI0029C80E32|nr:hypothetical protein [Marispirochaeta sp.]